MYKRQFAYQIDAAQIGDKITLPEGAILEKENGSASYMEEEFGHKPTDDEIRTFVMSWYNSQTDAAILLSLIHIWTIPACP